ncbi:hypothetical protein [Algoriphagus sp. AK58]|uniref:hypothetical protein n=1 Tax=Algoriphagus sp. AK58 TaxID=1406877 RepID=UPI001650A840|nr:hypothetical protein [Algoriphagus sp. AK58]
MKTVAHYLQLALLAFFLVFLIFFIFFDTLGSAFGMDPITSASMVKVFLTGSILFLAAWGTKAIYTKGLLDQIKKMEIEMNSVKAKLYDLEHPKSTQTSKPIPQKNQEEPIGTIRPRQNFTDQ